MTKLTLSQKQIEKMIAIEEAEINAKYSGGSSKIKFNRWQKYGKDRLYYSFQHVTKSGNFKHHKGNGYIDLETGEVSAPPSDCVIIKKLVVK